MVICAIVFEYAGFLKTLLISIDFKNSMFLYMDPISEESVDLIFQVQVEAFAYHHLYKVKYK